jgi:hypothetical protein
MKSLLVLDFSELGTCCFGIVPIEMGSTYGKF